MGEVSGFAIDSASPGGWTSDAGLIVVLYAARVLRGFKDFIMRGNVVELAVGVVIGAAFNGLVTQFTASFLEPLIKLISGGKAFSGQWHATKDVAFNWSAFLNAIISFLLVAAALYFLVVLPMNKLAERRARGHEPEPNAPSDEVRLLTEIRDALIAGQGGRPTRPPTSDYR